MEFSNSMDKPHSVQSAINLIWALIALNILVTLVNQWSGQISSGQFFFTLFLYGFYCIIPYKLNMKSNATRYVYSILVIISVLILLGGAVQGLSKLDLIISILSIPLHLFSIYLLFLDESKSWFLQTYKQERKEPTF